MQHLVKTIAAPGIAGYADRDRDHQLGLVVLVHRVPFHLFPQASRQRKSAPLVRSRHYYAELSPAQPCRHIRPPDVLRYDRGEVRDDDVSYAMTKLVVDTFEAVEVHQKNRQGVAPLLRARQLFLRHFVEMTAVIEASHLVTRRHLLQLGHSHQQLALMAPQEQNLHLEEDEAGKQPVC